MISDKLFERAMKVCVKHPWYEQVLEWNRQHRVSNQEVYDGITWLEKH